MEKLNSFHSAYTVMCAFSWVNCSEIVKAIDTTGAGDIFHGAFTYGLAMNWPMEKVLRSAKMAGAMSTTRIGGRNSIFTHDEMEQVWNEIK